MSDKKTQPSEQAAIDLDKLAQDAGFNLNALRQIVVPAPHCDARPYLEKFAAAITRQAAPEAPDSEQQACGISPTYSWLTEAARSGVPEVEHAARTMMAYYQGAEFPSAATVDAQADTQQAGAAVVQARHKDCENVWSDIDDAKRAELDGIGGYVIRTLYATPAATTASANRDTVDLVTAVMDQFGFLEGVNEHRTEELCQALESALNLSAPAQQTERMQPSRDDTESMRTAFENCAQYRSKLMFKRGGSVFAEDVPESDYVDSSVQAAWVFWQEAWSAALAQQGAAQAAHACADTERLNWLEAEVRRRGYCYLHNNMARYELLGLSIHADSLREAIDGCVARAAMSSATDKKEQK